MGPNFLTYPDALRAAAGHSVDLEGFEPSTSSVRLRRAPAALQALIFRVIGILPVRGGSVKTWVPQRSIKIRVNKDMENTYIFIVMVVSAYLIGSIPFGFLVARWRGVDISQVGSGNIGATNVGRNLGWKIGALVGVLDFMKGLSPVLLAQNIFTNDWQIIIISLVPVVGHIFPVWLNFKGGKGVATIFGVLAAYFGIPYFLVFLLLWILAVWLVKLMSLVNLITALIIPISFWLKYKQLNFVLLGLLLCVIIWLRHKENIKRLMAGKEHPLNY